MNEINMLGLLIAVCAWVLFYGLNIPIRAVIKRRHLRTHDVVAVFDVKRDPPQLDRQFLAPTVTFAVIMLTVLLMVSTRSERAIEVHLFSGFIWGLVLVRFVLMPLYQRSRVCRTDQIMFDREGVTFFQARTGRLSQGTFKSRVLWKDCFGYSFYKGYVLFALTPIGQIEQEYGEHREAMIDVLTRLGLHKLLSYDLIAPQEESSRQLADVEQRVLGMAQDVIDGYRSECVQLGLRIESEVLYSKDNPDEQFAYLQIGSWQGDESLHTVEWLLWAHHGDSLELLTLPGDRLYESLDDRVAVLIDRQMQALGREKERVMVQ